MRAQPIERAGDAAIVAITSPCTTPAVLTMLA
jgi:hypothetical protein